MSPIISRIAISCILVILANLACVRSDSSLSNGSSFIERQVIHLIDDWDEQHQSYDLFGGWLSLKRSHFDDTTRRTNDHGSLFGRIGRFLSQHTIDFNLPLISGHEALQEEGRKHKLKRFLVPFIILMVLKKSIEVPIMLAVLSLLAFKGLGAGLMSLMLSGATAFKSLFEHHHSSSKVSYEVVPQINHWSRSGGSGGIDYPNLDAGYQYRTLPLGTK